MLGEGAAPRRRWWSLPLRYDHPAGKSKASVKMSTPPPPDPGNVLPHTANGILQMCLIQDLKIGRLSRIVQGLQYNHKKRRNIRVRKGEVTTEAAIRVIQWLALEMEWPRAKAPAGSRRLKAEQARRRMLPQNFQAVPAWPAA